MGESIDWIDTAQVRVIDDNYQSIIVNLTVDIAAIPAGGLLYERAKSRDDSWRGVDPPDNGIRKILGQNLGDRAALSRLRTTDDGREAWLDPGTHVLAASRTPAEMITKLSIGLTANIGREIAAEHPRTQTERDSIKAPGSAGPPPQ
jgi:hypothetical protein